MPAVSCPNFINPSTVVGLPEYVSMVQRDENHRIVDLGYVEAVQGDKLISFNFAPVDAAE